MGMSVFSHVSSSVFDKPKVKVITKYINTQKAQNPNPFVFVIEKIVQIGRFTIAQVHYPNCTNYEGRKILLWHGHTLQNIKKLKAIDPHFSEDSFTPIARFEPTIRGWKMAEKMAKVGF
jgi:hypothetical protein